MTGAYSVIAYVVTDGFFFLLVSLQESTCRWEVELAEADPQDQG